MDSDLEERMEMVRDFVNEGRELLDDAEPQIIDMEKSALGSGKVDEEILNAVFRLFHSIKGTASFLDFQTIIGVTHEAETLLDIFRKGKTEITPYHVDLLCRATDFIRSILDVVERKLSDEGFEAEAESLVDDLRQAIAAVSGEGLAAPPPLQAGEENGLRITPEMARVFVEETLELCEEAESALRRGAADAESAGQAFRAFHNIKGNAGFFGYGDLESICRLAESVLDRIRSGQASTPATIFTLLEVIDAVRGKLEDLTLGGPGEIPGLGELCDRLEQLVEEQNSQPLEEAAAPSAPSLEDELEQLTAGDETPESISIEQPEEEKGNGSQAQEVRGAPSLEDELEQLTAGDETPESVSIEQPEEETGNGSQAQDLRPPASEVEDIQATLPASDILPPTSDTGRGAGSQSADAPAAGGARESGAGSAAVIRVDIDKLDKMLDLVGELVIAESMVANNQDLDILKNDRFGKAVLQLDKISREIQEVAMSMRMIPLDGVFRKMVRLVRDLAQKAGKQVDLEITGEDTEVDKTIIEQISDPLVHLIRNAVDHGLETPAERLAVGKPEVGRVTIEAKHSAGEVWITVVDDGRGLNRDKIFQKGLEKGLVRSEDREMKDDDVWRLIFEPGFSTAEQVSSISGRGVGMDVVKRNIEKLRGKVDVRSRAGVGTIFAVRIPLTLAIIEGMVVRIGANRYTIPISSIKESFRPAREQITRTPDGLEIVRIRGELQPVLRLHELYRVDPRYYQLSEGILIMVENSDNKCCLFVDELLGQQQIVIKGLPGYLSHVKGISGCAILGDGEISLILDIADLVSSVEEGCPVA